MIARLSRWILPLAILVGALALYRVASLASSAPAWQPASLAPRVILPKNDWPQVVTDQQLHDVLDRMKPGPEANTNVLVHALRLWGPQAEFNDGRTPSGREMLNYFLDDNAYQARAGAGAMPLFDIAPNGDIVVRAFDGQNSRYNLTSSHHQDDLLATMAESGVPLDTPLVTRNGTVTVQNLLESSLRKYHLSQLEYEWTCISYARYLFPQTPPTNEYGQHYNVDSLLDELIDLPLLYGPCNGTHRLEALVVLYRADEEAHALSPKQRQRILAHLKVASQILTQSQTPTGYWNRLWPAGKKALEDKTSGRYDQILVTGHHLEWMALAPPQVLPPRETIVRASQWLVSAMLEESDARLKEKYGPFSHAARALALWRGKQPFDAWKSLESAK